MKFIVIRQSNATFHVEDAESAEAAIELAKANKAENIGSTDNYQARQLLGKAPPPEKQTVPKVKQNSK